MNLEMKALSSFEMSMGVETSSSISVWCSADTEDIRVLDAYTDCMQKQYINVSNKMIDLLVGLSYGNTK
jgi:hypothetical protein